MRTDLTPPWGTSLHKPYTAPLSPLRESQGDQGFKGEGTGRKEGAETAED